ncbi:MAG TPA: DUF883 domain-containing protein [Terriglobales bacterium]|jgi:ElaB/YqjD/DUF883 family membrane-anchored ribosome-binding protein|nr:DUF883 domain-containing protein [Terriglobales bacterium]
MNEMTTKKLAEDFKVLIDDVEDLVGATASQTGERLADLRQRLQAKVDNARKGLAENTWFRKAQESKTRTESCLLKSSWAGWVIAASIGALLGLLLRRK